MRRCDWNTLLPLLARGAPSLRNYHAAVRDVGLWERKWQMCVKDLGWPPTQINLLGANYDSKFL